MNQIDMKKSMKLFVMTLCAIFMTLNFTSCSDKDKDDDGGVVDPVGPSLVGTWILKEGSATMTYVFKANGTFKLTFVDPEYPDDNDSVSGKYSVTGDLEEAASVRCWGTYDDGEEYEMNYIVRIEGRYLYLTDDEGDSFRMTRK